LIEDEQRTKCGGACWRSLTTKSDHQLRHKRGEINKLKHICIYH